MTRRIFRYTRPQYGSMWHSIAYRRGWMPVLTHSRVYNPYGRSIAAMRHASLFSMKRYPKSAQSLNDELRIRMFFRSYNTRHPNARKWRSR